MNLWTLMESQGEQHVLHNSTGMLHGATLIPGNVDTECTVIPIEICNENSNRNLNSLIIDRRIHQEERNHFVAEGIDNESLYLSQLEEFINNETTPDQSYFRGPLTHDSHQDSSHSNSVSTNVMVDASDGRSLHHQQLSQSSHHQHFLGKDDVISNISPNSYDTDVVSNIVIDSSYTYAHSHHSLPDSPPDSGSEPPYSPQDGAGRPTSERITNEPRIQNLLLQPNNANCSNGLVNLPYVKSSRYHTVQIQQGLCADDILLQQPATLTPLLTQQQQRHQHQQPLPTTPMSPGLQSNRESYIGVSPADMNGTNETQFLTPPRPKKRKLSQDSSRGNVKQESEIATDVVSCHIAVPNAANADLKNEDDYGYQDGNSSSSINDSGLYSDTNFQCIRFQPFQQHLWHTLCDHNLKELPSPHFRVDADKGFNFSNVDDAFVCQKKNHFQITCHAQSEGDAQFVKTGNGISKIARFQLHFYGVKMESLTQTIKVEQSQSDRSKKAFHPVLIELRCDEVTKVTVGRLHFSETTSNNMRKKGKPNPDQRYFYLVVGLHARCIDGNDFPIVSQSSEKIIVRASNPGQFENDVELCWQRGSSPESVFYAGRVGINMDHPDEALVVHGNVKITGQILKPSDCRIKSNIEHCDSRKQLQNIQQLNLVRFTYTPESSTQLGLVHLHETGVLAQEVQKILPEAVTTAESIVLRDGTKYENFLLVDKERIYMENVGAVRELSNVTETLETRIDSLERMYRKLTRISRKNVKKSSSFLLSLRYKKESHNLHSLPKFSINSSGHATINLVVLFFIVILASLTFYFLEFRSTHYKSNQIPVIHWNVMSTWEHHLRSNCTFRQSDSNCNRTSLNLTWESVICHMISYAGSIIVIDEDALRNTFFCEYTSENNFILLNNV